MSASPQRLPPPLKWAGGKRWLLPRLASYWGKHSHRRLVEPFCGALGVTLGLLPRRALLNDINPHLMHFLAQLRRGLVIRPPSTQPKESDSEAARPEPKIQFFMETGVSPLAPPAQLPLGATEEVRELFSGNSATPPLEADQATLAMDYDKELYYAHRDRFNQLLRSGGERTPEAAALFYYLNRTCFNGLCRFNSKGEFNVPFGRYSSVTYARDFSPYRRLFAEWEFDCVDFQKLPLEPGDFVYADPPYDVEFTQYAKEGFRWEDQERMAEWLAGHPGPVIISNQATNRIVALYRKLGYHLEFLQGPRRISCNGDRSPAQEVLAFRNLEELSPPAGQILQQPT